MRECSLIRRTSAPRTRIPRGTPAELAELAAFVYAVEHLEIAGYELLWHVAESAGASEIVELANRIANEERAMADRVFAAFDQAFEATVSDVGVST